MKIRSFAQTFTAFVFALSATATISQPSSAKATTFFCGTSKGAPVTVASTSRGDIPIIRWISNYFSGTNYNPQRRCKEVSNKFQIYYDNGMLNYLTTGRINRQPVVCVAKSLGSGCSEVLLTLEPKDNPNRVLQELLNLRVRAASAPITRGGPQVSEQAPVYVDLNEYLNTAPVEKGISPISQLTRETAQAQSQVPAVNSTNTITTADAKRPSLPEIINQGNLTKAVTAIEQSWERDYEGYFGANLSDQSLVANGIADTLGKLASQTGKKPALIYVVPGPKQLELVLVMPQSKPIRKSIPEADRSALLKVVKQFSQEIADPTKTNTKSYLATARQLYQWIIAPLEPNLQAQSIDTLVFCMGGGLRTLPLASLHNGQQFLVEKYSIGLIPAFNMTNTLYRDIKNSQVLAMGASQFTNQTPLPAVPSELTAIFKDLSGVLWPGPWSGKSLLNQEFTLNNLKSQRASQPFGIVHLATHAEFQPGAPKNSYIQFWDTKLRLNQMRQLQWNNPAVELLVLSACNTALGDKDAEMGFAGLAVQSGVKSALASLWNVSDEGTLALMIEFYQQLRTAPIKAEALRLAQIAMLRGQVRLEAGQLRGPGLRGGFQLPPNLAALGTKDFSHPYYWAAFTMIGNLW